MRGKLGLRVSNLTQTRRDRELSLATHSTLFLFYINADLIFREFHIKGKTLIDCPTAHVLSAGSPLSRGQGRLMKSPVREIGAKALEITIPGSCASSDQTNLVSILLPWEHWVSVQ